MLSDEAGPGTTKVSPLTVKVLLVDDQPSNLLTLEAILGDLQLGLVKAQSGTEALRCLLKDDFALILLDVRMPGMDGFEAATLIRQRRRCQHTPIIFLTAFDTDQVQMFKGYSLGAVDFLSKPLVPEVLRSKVSVFVEIFRKTEEVKRQGELLRTLERQAHERELAEARARWEAARLREEIRIAREIQQKLFPAAPLPLHGFDIAGASYPAEATGGDYFDYIPLADGALGIAIGDVSGHGLGPALLMAETRAYLRAFLPTRTDVGEVMALLNQALASDTPEDRFATLLLGRLSMPARTFLYASAGHAVGFILSASGEVRQPLESTGIPLAILPEAKFATSPEFPLAAGEMVVLLTDGLSEARGAGGELYGDERILEVVRAQRQQSARALVDTLFNEVHRFCCAESQLDDMTAIVIKVEDQAGVSVAAASPSQA
jgi:serine phosphatase RsbU (regulator of sigma subunit)